MPPKSRRISVLVAVANVVASVVVTMAGARPLFTQAIGMPIIGQQLPPEVMIRCLIAKPYVFRVIKTLIPMEVAVN